MNWIKPAKGLILCAAWPSTGMILLCNHDGVWNICYQHSDFVDNAVIMTIIPPLHCVEGMFFKCSPWQPVEGMIFRSSPWQQTSFFGDRTSPMQPLNMVNFARWVFFCRLSQNFFRKSHEKHHSFIIISSAFQASKCVDLLEQFLQNSLQKLLVAQCTEGRLENTHPLYQQILVLLASLPERVTSKLQSESRWAGVEVTKLSSSISP